jgi:hypothetical protein
MRPLFKTLFVIWILDTVGLLWLFGWMHFHGAASGDSELAGDLGAI